MSAHDHDDPTVQAGEYVLGVLSADEARVFEHRMAADRALRTEVDYWERQLDGLNTIAAPLEPDADLWARIERDLPLRRATPAAAPIAPWWGRLGLWQGIGVTGLAASLILAVLLFALPRDDGAWVYTAVLESPERGAGWLVRANAENDIELIPLTQTTVAPDRALQFWTLADPKQGPVSLGLVPTDRPVRISASKVPGVKPGQLFEITLEPASGSPYNRPSGPILFKGYIVATG